MSGRLSIPICPLEQCDKLSGQGARKLQRGAGLDKMSKEAPAQRVLQDVTRTGAFFVAITAMSYDTSESHKLSHDLSRVRTPPYSSDPKSRKGLRTKQTQAVFILALLESFRV